MNITQREYNLIRDELTSGCWEMSFEDEHGVELDRSVVNKTEDELAQELENGWVPQPMTQLKQWALHDTCDICTWFNNVDEEVAFGDVTKGEVLAMRRAAKSLESKLPVYIPR